MEYVIYLIIAMVSFAGGWVCCAIVSCGERSDVISLKSENQLLVQKVANMERGNDNRPCI